MGKRGPKKIPTLVLRNRGSWLAGTRQNEPKLPVEAPEPPEWLAGEAKAEWERITPILIAAGVISQADRAILTCYCQAWAGYLEACKFCVDKGGKPLVLIKTSNGNLIQNPAIGVRNTMWQQVKAAAACLGITPADRSNVRAAPKAETADPKKRFFKGGA